jgi:hypothetical protein
MSLPVGTGPDKSLPKRKKHVVSRDTAGSATADGVGVGLVVAPPLEAHPTTTGNIARVIAPPIIILTHFIIVPHNYRFFRVVFCGPVSPGNQ